MPVIDRGVDILKLADGILQMLVTKNILTESEAAHIRERNFSLNHRYLPGHIVQ